MGKRRWVPSRDAAAAEVAAAVKEPPAEPPEETSAAPEPPRRYTPAEYDRLMGQMNELLETDPASVS